MAPLAKGSLRALTFPCPYRLKVHHYALFRPNVGVVPWEKRRPETQSRNNHLVQSWTAERFVTDGATVRGRHTYDGTEDDQTQGKSDLGLT